VIVDDTLLVANMNIPSRELAGIPLHVVGPGGRVLRSFGENREGYRYDLGAAMMRYLAPAGPSRVWSAYASEYRIERWHVTGQLELAYRRETAWFDKPNYRGVYPDPSQPPDPWLIGVQQDGDGLLWVAVLVGDPEWHEGVLPEKNDEGTYFSTPDPTNFQDTMIEVIDPRTHAVIATTRVDFVVKSFIDDQHLAAYRESDVGVPTVEVWRFSVKDR
jgi:hypothetical protein